jgi:hypothetical protein
MQDGERERRGDGEKGRQGGYFAKAGRAALAGLIVV